MVGPKKLAEFIMYSTWAKSQLVFHNLLTRLCFVLHRMQCAIRLSPIFALKSFFGVLISIGCYIWLKRWRTQHWMCFFKYSCMSLLFRGVFFCCFIWSMDDVTNVYAVEYSHYFVNIIILWKHKVSIDVKCRYGRREGKWHIEFSISL